MYFCTVLEEASLGREKIHVIESEFQNRSYHLISYLISMLPQKVVTCRWSSRKCSLKYSLTVMCGSRKEHTHPMEGHWEFFEGGGKQNLILNQSMRLNQNFHTGRVQNRKPAVCMLCVCVKGQGRESNFLGKHNTSPKT